MIMMTPRIEMVLMKEDGRSLGTGDNFRAEAMLVEMLDVGCWIVATSGPLPYQPLVFLLYIE